MTLREKTLACLSRWSRDANWRIRGDLRELAPLASGRMLDLGCGGRPYSDLFAGAASYTGVDLPPERSANQAPKQADLYGDLAALPLRDAVFDAVLCTQVLEHVPSPERVLQEAARVLKEDGLLILTVPFLAAEHEEPHDYFRYTSYGIEALLKRNGFDGIRVKKQFGFWSAIGEMVYWHFHRKVRRTAWEKYWYAVGTTLLLRCFHVLNRLDPDEKLVLNLCVTARRTPRLQPEPREEAELVLEKV